MKVKKTVLLFEVVVVILIVSIVSLFFFRGYGVFLKAGRKGQDYLLLCLFLEEKMFKLQVDEINHSIGSRSYLEDDQDMDYKWGLELEEVEFQGISKGVLTAGFSKRDETLNNILFLATGK